MSTGPCRPRISALATGWYARCRTATRTPSGEWSLSIEGGSRDAVSGNVALLLWRVAERCGARPAVVERDQSVGYAALIKRTAAIAAALLAAGVAPDDPVAILLERGGDAAAAFFATLAVGAITVFVNETLRPRQVTVLAAVPPLWLRLLNVPAFREAPLPDLRVMTNAGGRLPTEGVRALRRAQPGARLYLMYGLTEALRSTYLPPEEVDRRPDSIGRAIPGAAVYVLREDGTAATPGEVGELVQRGPTVTLGYWKDPELTAQVYRPNPLRPPGAPDTERVVFSGDLVRSDADGFLYFVSRKDRIIKTMGYRVGPDEVANVLYGSGEVAEAAVLGEPDELWGERIVAYVVLTGAGSLERLKAYCGRELPRYLQPARIEVRSALPVLPSGKHDLGAVQAGSP